MIHSKSQRHINEEVESFKNSNHISRFSIEIKQSLRKCDEPDFEKNGNHHNMLQGRKTSFERRQRKTLEFVKLIFQRWYHLALWISEKKRKMIIRLNLPNKYNFSDDLKESLAQMTFDVCSYGNNEVRMALICEYMTKMTDQLVPLLEFMFEDLEVTKGLKLDYSTLHRFLLTVQENYEDNPYHNFRHGFCVAHALYVIIKQCNLKSYLPFQSLIALLTACICHDISHPGLTNRFHVLANTDFVELYGTVSTLEYHHIAVTKNILQDNNTNIFQFIAHEEFSEIWKKIQLLILATDIARHNELLKNYKINLKNFTFNRESHRVSLEEIIIKSCDVSHSARPMKISIGLTEGLLQEFDNQIKLEMNKGIPVLKEMDSARTEVVPSMISFLENIPQQLYENLAKLFHPINGAFLTTFYENLEILKDLDQNSLNENLFDGFSLS